MVVSNKPSPPVATTLGHGMHLFGYSYHQDATKRGSFCDTILPPYSCFVAIFFRCRNNSENISPKYLESAEICRIFAPVSLTI